MINVNDLKEKFILPVYKDAYSSDKPYIVIKGGGCSGKSYFVTSMLILDTFSEKRNSSLIVVRDETLHPKRDQIEMVLNDMGIRDSFDFDKREGVLKNKETGNKIRISDIEDGRTYTYAAGADKVWLDDASMFSEADVKKIDRITKTKCQIIFTFNPIASGCVPWLISTFFESEYTEDNCTLSTTYKDNPRTTEDMAKTLESFKNTSEFYYKTYCLGEFVEL